MAARRKERTQKTRPSPVLSGCFRNFVRGPLLDSFGSK